MDGYARAFRVNGFSSVFAGGRLVPCPGMGLGQRATPAILNSGAKSECRLVRAMY
jgi:hypothetical protein